MSQSIPMNFYSRYIFPHVCNFVMGRSFFADYRRELLKGASGEILEVGFGSGLNLPHYPASIRKITTVEPSIGMNRIADRQLARCDIEVDQRIAFGEEMPFDDNVFDCVVCTWTLCSVTDIERTLQEAYRVLRGGGRLLFLEHGLSDRPRIQKWQRRLNWVNMRLSGGCRLNVDFPRVFHEQPFSNVEIEQFSVAQAPKLHRTMYRGAAVK